MNYKELVELGAKHAFKSHWPNDNWERFKDGDLVKVTYIASFTAALDALYNAGLVVVDVNERETITKD